MYQRVLVPVDGSDTSTRGLTEAIRLATEQRAKLRLLHVVDHAALPAASDAASSIPIVLEAMRRTGRKVLDDAVKAASAAGLDAEPLFLESTSGRVADVIVAQAERWPADLIVMGTHGRHGVSHFLLGSDAEGVLRASPVPVLLVRNVSTAAPVKAAAAA